MYKRTTTVINKTGLHARPGSDFVHAAAKFSSKITIRRLDEEDDPVNAKSIAFVLSLGIGKGIEVELAAEGEDEQAAVDSLIEMINGGFGDL
ncbi:MAG: HPr family phosphocarrier protein [Spirochaetaceae bacterium]|jgi:phosphocarrier protein|nr:HPr family phosphocarrier protein [Spirochaetaceae bacterium]